MCCDGNLFSWCICSAAFEVDGVNETMATHRRKMIHEILDNLAVHKTPAVKAWAAMHPKVHSTSRPPTPPG